MADADRLWDEARRRLDGLPGGRGLNIAHEAVDRHVDAGHGSTVALRWLPKHGAGTQCTYEELRTRTNCFANVLSGLGIAKGDRVFSLAGRIPEVHVTALGAMKAGAVFCPLYSAFGPDPIRQRLLLGDATVLVTTEELYRKKVAALRASLPSLRHVIVIAPSGAVTTSEGTRDWATLMAAADEHFVIAPTDPSDMALVHFTSGTTGTPKGAVHVHDAVVAHHATALHSLALRRGDVFWCTADPGWVTGTSYGIIAPLTIGATVLIDEGELDARRWYETLERERVTVLYTAPTAIRMLMRAGADLAHERDLSSLRFVASVGEPLDPEAVGWGLDAFGTPIHDNWWQTETGAIMIANDAGMDIRPGSMGRPVPGVTAAIVERTVLADGTIRATELTAPDTVGELALRPGWPSMFRGYLDEQERYDRCFADGWYLTGDLARRDADGYHWFVGRADDVIKSAGHLIGPFEVESALMRHPAVAEAGVIGRPDATAGAIVKAFIVLRSGREPTDELRRDILGFARTRLGPTLAPREVEFTDDLPRNRSGKIMRRVLRARQLGLPEGDLSMVGDDMADRP